MAKLKIENGKLVVPNNITIPYIAGDGVGAEISPVTQSIIDTAVKKCYAGERKIEWLEVLAGEKAFKQTGLMASGRDHENISRIPDRNQRPVNHTRRRGYSIAKRCFTARTGSICMPTSGTLVQRRRFSIKEPHKVNMHIFRENTEDIYAGIEWQQGSPEAEKFLHFLQNEMKVSKIRFPQTSSFGVKPVSIEGSERLIRSAIQYAIEHKLPSVTLVHKGNIMKFTEGGFKLWGYAMAEREFGNQVFTMMQYERLKKSDGEPAAENALKKAIKEGKIIIKDVIADAFLQNTLLIPEEYSVIATLNLNGDYISDQLAAMVGGIGIAPGANINYITGHAIFEATHGTAPNIAGKNRVNPSSLLLSGVMMLEYLGWQEAAANIVNALEKTFQSHKATIDLARFMDDSKTLTTTEFRDEIIRNL